MSAMHLVHVAALFAWLGLVCAETVMEWCSWRDPTLAPACSRFHDAIDRVVEIPLLVVIVGTGAALLLRTGVLLDMFLAVKIGLGLVAVSANLGCFRMVRRRARGSAAAPYRAHSREYFLWLAVGFAAGIGALGMGLWRGGWI